jgi:signal transduction histidine kinase
MNFFRRLRRRTEDLAPTLRRKLTIAVSVTLLLCGGIFAWVAHRTGYSILESEIQSKVQGISATVRGVLQRAEAANPDLDPRSVLRLIAGSPNIPDIFIVDARGEVLWTARQPAVPGRIALDRYRQVEEDGEERVLETDEGGIRYEYIAFPLTAAASQGDSREKLVVLKVVVHDVLAIALRHRTMNIIMTVLTFVGLGFIIIFSLSFLIVRPITALHGHLRRLEGGIRHLGQGETVPLPLLDEPQRKDEIAGLFRDFNKMILSLNRANAALTELHNDQLQQADRLATTGEMAASIAHEIKNPIAGVLGALRVFQSDLPPGDPKQEIVREMILQLHRMNQTVTDLLSYARPMPPSFTGCSVNEVISRTVNMLSRQSPGGRIAIRTELADGLPPVPADEKQLQQVIWNIVLNGLQSMEGPGTLTVTSSRENGGVRIDVKDTGKGIPPDQIEKVFKPFYTTKHKGTGLGMTISRRIVDQHRGTIGVESSEGRGTTVTIILPSSGN